MLELAAAAFSVPVPPTFRHSETQWKMKRDRAQDGAHSTAIDFQQQSVKQNAELLAV